MAAKLDDVGTNDVEPATKPTQRVEQLTGKDPPRLRGPQRDGGAEAGRAGVHDSGGGPGGSIRSDVESPVALARSALPCRDDQAATGATWSTAREMPRFAPEHHTEHPATRR